MPYRLIFEVLQFFQYNKIVGIISSGSSVFEYQLHKGTEVFDISVLNFIRKEYQNPCDNKIFLHNNLAIIIIFLMVYYLFVL